MPGKIPEHLFEYKPHPKSMNMGYLALLVTEISLWIHITVEKGVSDFATSQHFQPITKQQLVEDFDNNSESTIVALQHSTDEEPENPFLLQTNGENYSGSQRSNQLGILLTIGASPWPVNTAHAAE